SAGDYVVHENYGIGIYRGIVNLETDGVGRDYMQISYGTSGTLYIPVTNLNVVQKYASADAKPPKINRLDSPEWKRTRSRVRTAVEEIADNLVRLYSARQYSEGYEYGPDTVWQREFEEMFPFEETEDQLQAIRDVKQDMESNKIMDRLILGDVGFGKTEVAIRAAFKAVQEGKQVAFLVPTTILAEQHFSTIRERMHDYPVTVELLSRFRSEKEQNETIRNLKRGMTDIVIGTHKLLNEKVQFKDLGLLIIDEEQRFGVMHKERIKELKTNVDVLTLSATPIPRTLHMSMIGVRDMSLITEPPEDRRAIQTYVMEYSAELVREAIQREIARNGQVYYVYNRANDIADVAAGLEELLPEADITYIHGRMNERDIESRMLSFIEGRYDVLVSTTIIESGLDIPNVNTIIIHDAERYGLAQLYQLRGRVGRSSRQSYAFIMYRKNRVLSEVAEKRLTAIRQFTELGSGMKIALQDLEIRGAGTLLGNAQSGHMALVGYDLYCKMLSEAVREAKGEKKRSDSFDTVLDIP
ncbi:MAG: transcription-repair coupling factor, partial [Lachnospiraceae bacterium]|nr:transcription-repair coupling factor [Lachnospiraceae bacterium]